MRDAQRLFEETELLVKRMRLLEAEAYTERDGGDWYVVAAGGGGRLAEGFARRNDARQMILVLCGDLMPRHWKVHRSTDRLVEICIERDARFREFVTIWRAEAELYTAGRRSAGKPHLTMWAL